MAVLEVSTEPARGEGTQRKIGMIVVEVTRDLLTVFLFPSSHCITGSGIPGQFAEGEDDDSLSPEACYECKINGGGKGGRHRRNADENEISQVHVVANCFSMLVSDLVQACCTQVLSKADCILDYRKSYDRGRENATARLGNICQQSIGSSFFSNLK